MFVTAWKWEGYPRCRNSILEVGGTCWGKILLLITIPKKTKCLQNIRTGDSLQQSLEKNSSVEVKIRKHEKLS